MNQPLFTSLPHKTAETWGLPTTLTIIVVVLTVNMDIADGFVNEAKGTVVRETSNCKGSRKQVYGGQAMNVYTL